MSAGREDDNERGDRNSQSAFARVVDAHRGGDQRQQHQQPKPRLPQDSIDVAESEHDAVGMQQQVEAAEPVAHRALDEEQSQQDRQMSRGARRNPRRRFLEVERAARPIDRDRHPGREHDQHQEQIAHLLEQGHREDVEADVVAERLLDDSERHAVESLQVDVPAGGLALRREQRQHCSAARDDHAPRHAFAERANQLGQIDLDHLVGTAHDAQPLVIAARADRNQPADENGG